MKSIKDQMKDCVEDIRSASARIKETMNTAETEEHCDCPEQTSGPLKDIDEATKKLANLLKS